MHGIPVLTSDRDFARDICGDGALYFEPTDPRSAVECLVTGLKLPREAGATHRELGVPQVKSWSAVTAAYVDVLRRATGEPKGVAGAPAAGEAPTQSARETVPGIVPNRPR
jgi:glycosyltransferase involved in cell wall biosynthesis